MKDLKSVSTMNQIDDRKYSIETEMSEGYRLNILGDFSSEYMDLMERHTVPMEYRTLDTMILLTISNMDTRTFEEEKKAFRDVAIQWSAQENYKLIQEVGELRKIIAETIVPRTGKE